jgi:hypothetical protein
LLYCCTAVLLYSLQKHFFCLLVHMYSLRPWIWWRKIPSKHCQYSKAGSIKSVTSLKVVLCLQLHSRKLRQLAKYITVSGTNVNMG